MSLLSFELVMIMKNREETAVKNNCLLSVEQPQTGDLINAIFAITNRNSGIFSGKSQPKNIATAVKVKKAVCRRSLRYIEEEMTALCRISLVGCKSA